MLNIISQRHDLLAQVIGDDLLVKAGRLDHDEQRVVAADEVVDAAARHVEAESLPAVCLQFQGTEAYHAFWDEIGAVDGVYAEGRLAYGSQSEAGDG